jgi:hypothetical protein
MWIGKRKGETELEGYDLAGLCIRGRGRDRGGVVCRWMSFEAVARALRLRGDDDAFNTGHVLACGGGVVDQRQHTLDTRTLFVVGDSQGLSQKAQVRYYY